jgi:hypothetical protein
VGGVVRTARKGAGSRRAARQRMPRKKGQKKGVGKHATGQRKVSGASLRAMEQRAAPPPAARAAAAAAPAAAAAAPAAQPAQFVVGMAVEYESATHKKWILTVVDGVQPDGLLVLVERPVRPL